MSSICITCLDEQLSSCLQAIQNADALCKEAEVISRTIPVAKQLLDDRFKLDLARAAELRKRIDAEQIKLDGHCEALERLAASDRKKQHLRRFIPIMLDLAKETQHCLLLAGHPTDVAQTIADCQSLLDTPETSRNQNLIVRIDTQRKKLSQITNEIRALDSSISATHNANPVITAARKVIEHLERELLLIGHGEKVDAVLAESNELIKKANSAARTNLSIVLKAQTDNISDLDQTGQRISDQILKLEQLAQKKHSPVAEKAIQNTLQSLKTKDITLSSARSSLERSLSRQSTEQRLSSSDNKVLFTSSDDDDFAGHLDDSGSPLPFGDNGSLYR